MGYHPGSSHHLGLIRLNVQSAIERASGPLDRHRTALGLLAVAALTLLAWHNRFIQDDAFITFQYARRLAEGAGLTWADGERVEGYTNFLWTLLMAIPFRLGLDPVPFAHAIGLALFPGSLLLTRRIATIATGSATAGLVAMLLLGTNYTFSAYATGGLETQLHVFLLLGATALAIGPWREPLPDRSSAAGISLLAAAAMMTRLDSALTLTAVYVYLGIALLRAHRGGRAGAAATAAWLVAPGAIVVLAWLAWKLAYYGDVLPNTYYAKMVPVLDVWRAGVHYLWLFFRSYWLLPVLVVPLLAWRAASARWSERLTLLGAILAVGLLYALRIGGDFMEFRALVPVLPALFVLVAWLLVCVSTRALLSVALALIVVAGSVYHARTFVIERGVESIAVLEDHLYGPKGGWIRVGQRLEELFGHLEPPPRIAVTAAGAIPFHAPALPATDIHGITDPWVARNGLRTDPRTTNPGHHRRAPFEYLAERGVNLVVGHPWVDRIEPGPRPAFGLYGLSRFGIEDVPLAHRLPEGAVMKVLEIDLDAERRVYVLYLMQSDGVDDVVRANDIRRHRVIPRRSAS